MKNKIGYDYVVHPGTVSGVAFVTSYELPKFIEPLNDELPEATPAKARRSLVSRSGFQSMIRLPQAFHRLVRQRILRRPDPAHAAA